MNTFCVYESTVEDSQFAWACILAFYVSIQFYSAELFFFPFWYTIQNSCKALKEVLEFTFACLRLQWSPDNRIDFLQEMKTQCFGGEYMGEVFDHMLKRYDSQGRSVHLSLPACITSCLSVCLCLHLSIFCSPRFLYTIDLSSLHRMSYRRQKRWWNAYILFYERLDIVESNRKIDLDRRKWSDRGPLYF